MAAIDQPSGQALTIREAAAACGISPRTIRRKLNAEAFPNAFKLRPRIGETEGVWKIPIADLETAGLAPTLLHPTITNGASPAPEPQSDGPTVLELVRSDRFGRLRAELAEAVAAAEIALLRAEAERWRSLADERAQALDRADTALKALTTAMGSDSVRAGVSRGSHEEAPAQGDIVAVPPLVRAEAMRYTATLQALHELRKQQNRWWQFWRG
ncbi:MAG: helix-turn-helix transcriptional regulator [Acidimicrobiia bacterium]